MAEPVLIAAIFARGLLGVQMAAAGTFSTARTFA
jgi:hypothetical protein